MNSVVSYKRWAFCCLVFCLPAGADVIHVDVHATGNSNGTSWAHAFTSLSAGIERASAGDEVRVAEGTYRPIVLKNGVKVLGGFAGTEGGASASDPDAHKTYISGGGRARAVESVGNDSSALLGGFYITHGFIGAPDRGAGILLKNSDAMVVNCVFTNNRSVAAGGAVGIWGGSPTFVNCKFHDNDGGWGAGAVVTERLASPTFVNCLFHHNKAWEGGGVTVRDGAAAFTNCTFTDNDATKGKGGALFDNLGKSVLRNCIVWNNTCPVPGAGEIHAYRSIGTTDVAYSDVKGGWPGAGNRDADPLFVDAAANDYRLKAASPCRNAGDDSSLPKDVADINSDGHKTDVLPLDLGLVPRIEGDSVDMGAFERHPGNE